MIQTIMKRNGEVVLFDASKIRNAILKANSHISGERMSDYDLDKVTAMVVDALNAGAAGGHHSQRGTDSGYGGRKAH